MGVIDQAREVGFGLMHVHHSYCTLLPGCASSRPD
jgi:hypothetical protein